MGSEDDDQYTVATIFIPSKAKKNKFVSCAPSFADPFCKYSKAAVDGIAYDSSDIDCSPSYFFQQGSPDNHPVAQEEPLIIGLLLSGYTVVSADYEGVIAAYTNGPLMGRQSLDALRAAINFGPANLSSDAKVVMMGYRCV